MFVFVWFFVPETKGVSLEAMDKMFGITDAPNPTRLGDDATEAGAPAIPVAEKLESHPQSQQVEKVV
jgi:hypothetical protein